MELEQNKGVLKLEKALSAPLKAENLINLFNEKVNPTQYDLVFISGIGNAWPIVRSHSLLNNLQKIMIDTPLVLFYPGCYDGQSVKLFGKLKSNSYYRAFRLVQ